MLKTKDPERALKDFKKSIKINPKHVPSYLAKALLYSVTFNRPARALADINQAIEIDPLNFQCNLVRGNIHFALGEFLKAEKDYLKAREIDPSKVEVYDRLMELYERPLKDAEKLFHWTIMKDTVSK